MRGALRVIAGAYGGRRIDAPGGDGTRPTSDRVREAIFNALGSLDAIEGARVLDAFAGSGAMAIEALSRGAASAVLVESDPAARSVAASNVELLGLGDRATVRAGDGAALARTLGPWDLVLLDPPYDYDDWEGLLGGILASVRSGGVIVAESDREVEVPVGFDVLSQRGHGGTVVTLLTPTGEPS